MAYVELGDLDARRMTRCVPAGMHDYGTDSWEGMGARKRPKLFSKAAFKAVAAATRRAVSKKGVVAFKAVAAATRRAVSKKGVVGRIFQKPKSAKNIKRLKGGLKIAGVVAAVAGVAVGGAVFGPAILAKLGALKGGAALSLLSKSNALRKKLGQPALTPADVEAAPQAILAEANAYDALPAAVQPFLEPVQAIAESGEILPAKISPVAPVATVAVAVTEPQEAPAEAPAAPPVVQARMLGNWKMYAVVAATGGIVYLLFSQKRA